MGAIGRNRRAEGGGRSVSALCRCGGGSEQPRSMAGKRVRVFAFRSRRLQTAGRVPENESAPRRTADPVPVAIVADDEMLATVTYTDGRVPSIEGKKKNQKIIASSLWPDRGRASSGGGGWSRSRVKRVGTVARRFSTGSSRNNGSDVRAMGEKKNLLSTRETDNDCRNAQRNAGNNTCDGRISFHVDKSSSPADNGFPDRSVVLFINRNVSVYQLFVSSTIYCTHDKTFLCDW